MSSFRAEGSVEAEDWCFKSVYPWVCLLLLMLGRRLTSLSVKLVLRRRLALEYAIASLLVDGWFPTSLPSGLTYFHTSRLQLFTASLILFCLLKCEMSIWDYGGTLHATHLISCNKVASFHGIYVGSDQNFQSVCSVVSVGWRKFGFVNLTFWRANTDLYWPENNHFLKYILANTGWWVKDAQKWGKLC